MSCIGRSEEPEQGLARIFFVITSSSYVPKRGRFWRKAAVPRRPEGLPYLSLNARAKESIIGRTRYSKKVRLPVLMKVSTGVPG